MDIIFPDTFTIIKPTSAAPCTVIGGFVNTTCMANYHANRISFYSTATGIIPAGIPINITFSNVGYDPATSSGQIEVDIYDRDILACSGLYNFP